ncbi:ABC transporter permease [Luteipulveratus sp. YIM 133132]|uniref:ABC transporter permease n=1 Tax=Luteipulveratus flavus TaxID=3031728 RepID=UPI0023B14EEF|nr:ABC transporter permease [Luteipulveratus sp. YIM 133132]MDE9367087.1 ABC transporter permease [Luteipulveratus sp. YIM 133132]
MTAGLEIGTRVVQDAPRSRRIPTKYLLASGVAGLVLLSLLRIVTGANDIDSGGIISAALIGAVPIGLAGLGGLWSERAGVVNIGLEGMMVLGTWGAAWAGIKWGPWMGLVGGIVAGLVGAAIHALATIGFGVDHIVSGVALNVIAPGATSYLASRTFTGLQGGGPTQSPPLKQLPRFSVPGIEDPLTDLERKQWFLLSDVAGILRGLLTNLSVVTIIAILLVVATWWILWRTPFGLRLRSCGESPVAAETLGVNVYLYKVYGVLASGALAGLAGAFLAQVAANAYREGQTGGRGYIGLAAMIFGNWRPGGLAGGSLLFGYTDAARLRNAGSNIHALILLAAVLLVVIGLWQLLRRRRVVQGVIALVVGVGALLMYLLTDQVSSELAATTPYVVTLLVMALASQRLRMPAADGKIYRRGEGQ